MQKILNYIQIHLDGRLNASLDWSQDLEQARLYKGQEQIFWELDLGIAEQLKLPLSDQMQFNAFFLSLEHFRDVVWKEFEQDSAGLCFFNSSADFSPTFTWDELQLENWHGWLKEHFLEIQSLREETVTEIACFEECDPSALPFKRLSQLFCRDVVAEYLQLLAVNLTDAIPLYIRLNASKIADPLTQALLTTTERFEPFQLIIEEGFFNQSKDVSLGICLPSIDRIPLKNYKGLAEVLAKLKRQNDRVRLIPEHSLLHNWNGLDDLIVLSDAINSQGRRKLQGFCAAGGRVLTIGSPLGLSNEILFS